MAPPPYKIVAEPSPKRFKLSDQTTEEEEEEEKKMAESESDISDRAIEPAYTSDSDEAYGEISARFPKLSVIEATEPLPLITEEERRLFCPPENPRFQLCCLKVWFNSYKRRGKLFGNILAWNDTLSPDPGSDMASAVLFNRELDESLVVRSMSYVHQIYPGGCDGSIPASTYLDFFSEVYLITHENGKDNPNFIEVAHGHFCLDFLTSWIKGCYEGGHFVVLDGEHGSITLYYVLIRNAVDAVLEITFEAEPELCQKPEYILMIFASYGPDFKVHDNYIEKEHYKLILFQSRPFSLLTTGKVPLLQSVVAVPVESSLVINAWVHHCESWYNHMDHTFVFPAKLKDISESCFKDEDCSLNVRVNWKYELNT